MMVDQAIFSELVEGILALMREQVVRIVLYGSVARGDDTPASDIDIALILREPLDKEMKSRLLDLTVELDWEHDTLLSVIDIEETFFLKWKKTMPFLGNIEKEGIVLWKAA